MDEIKKDLLLGLYVKPNLTTVGDWVKYWLNSYKKITLKPRTFDGYEIILKKTIQPYIGNIPLQKLTTKDIQLMYNTRYENGLSGNSIRKVHNVLKPALKQAVIEGIISKNPAEYVQLPETIKADIKVFNEQEQELFEKIAEEYRLFNAFVFNLDTGLRTSEILALTWDCIDFDKNLLIVKKNLVYIKNRGEGNKNILLVQDSSKTQNSTRTIPLTNRCINMLKQLKLKQQKLTDIIFCNQNGGYITPRNYTRTFEKVINKTGIDKCSPHTMRHTFATRLFEVGVPAKTISQLLGHSSVSFTLDVYVSVLPDSKVDAIKKLETHMKSIL